MVFWCNKMVLFKSQLVMFENIVFLQVFFFRIFALDLLTISFFFWPFVCRFFFFGF